MGGVGEMNESGGMDGLSSLEASNRGDEEWMRQAQLPVRFLLPPPCSRFASELPSYRATLEFLRELLEKLKLTLPRSLLRFLRPHPSSPPPSTPPPPLSPPTPTSNTNITQPSTPSQPSLPKPLSQHLTIPHPAPTSLYLSLQLANNSPPPPLPSTSVSQLTETLPSSGHPPNCNTTPSTPTARTLSVTRSRATAAAGLEDRFNLLRRTMG